jgi:NAD(P) transhydrogenase subunit beta
MENSLTVAYLISAVLFIMSLGGLSKQETARRGNIYGILGMAIAVGATFLHDKVGDFALIAPAVLIGCLIGAVLAAKVAMTSMPELVAALHSFVGLAAVLVGYSTFYDPHPKQMSGIEHMVHDVEIYLAIAIGAITFTGSVIAYFKLSGKMGGKPLLLPGRHALNGLVAIALLVLCVTFVTKTGPGPLNSIIIMTVLASLLGVHLVMAIGGADMPVVVSLLNSYSGWTAAAAGFMLENDLLIVTGALVGSSGAILSYIMCKAMNRSIWNVVFAGFGSAETPATTGPPKKIEGEVKPVEVDELAQILVDASSVVIIPGYGMAVAQAQHTVHEFAELLRARGTKVRFAIHPVAGRLPGHMNVLLAEAGVPYDIVFEMAELNADFPRTDVAMVIGANDIVNPGALDDPASPIYGMPVLHAWEAETAIVLKRSLNVGYAGVGNPLFLHKVTRMFFGDAKDNMAALVDALKAASKAA